MGREIIRHYRERRYNERLNRYEDVHVASVYIDEEDRCAGISVCSPDDFFDKKEGVKLAKYRADQAAEEVAIMRNSGEFPEGHHVFAVGVPVVDLGRDARRRRNRYRKPNMFNYRKAVNSLLAFATLWCRCPTTHIIKVKAPKGFISSRPRHKVRTMSVADLFDSEESDAGTLTNRVPEPILEGDEVSDVA